MTISLTASEASTSIAWSAVSVVAQLLGAQREHPRAVDRHVAVADDDDPLAVEVELAVRMVGMAVVPADEGRGGLGPRQVLSGDPEPPVGRRADRVDHRVVALEQVGAMQVAPELDAAEEAEALLRRGLLVDAHDRLDLRVVRARRRRARARTASAGDRTGPRGPAARRRARARRRRSRPVLRRRSRRGVAWSELECHESRTGGDRELASDPRRREPVGARRATSAPRRRARRGRAGRCSRCR